MNWIFIIYLITSLFVGSSADLFTSIAELQHLLSVEKGIPEIINSYIETENARLEELKRFADQYKNKNDDTSKNINSVSNPINAFHLIKRLTSTWKELVNQMKQDVSSDFLHNISTTTHYSFPSDEDLTGAISGLLRLQDTYRLDTHDLARGIVYGKKISNELSAHDCFEIGRNSYNQEDYYHVLLWMEESLEKLKSENPPTASESDILEYLAFALYKQGNLKRALQLTDRLYDIAPNHPRAKGNIQWYEDQLSTEGVKRSDMRKTIPPLSNTRPVDNFENLERNIYEALCRGEVPVSVKETSKLYCYYKMDRPYLRLAPLKVDIVRFNPLAVVFRDVINDAEIEVVQMLAKPKLARATVQNSQTGQLETASYRISKSAWLKGIDHEVIARINNRLEYMTNLDMDTAEELQIANYGIGGHYDPHYDFARKEETKAFSDLGTGNRIATVLFYMSTPELGGATVFTELKQTNWPTKNDALFWYNLLRSGEGDLRTRHAACPVLLGIKWVSNKWIHEKNQEFRRPCGLKPSTYERYVGDLGAPEPRYHWNIRSA